LYANKVDHNLTEDAVTAGLLTWKRSWGQYVPPEEVAKLPTNARALLRMFERKQIPIHRIPVCPADCRLLDDVEPDSKYVCDCDGKQNLPWRMTNAGSLVANRQFNAISIVELIRSWLLYML